MEGGSAIKRYQVGAKFHDGVVEWHFCVETEAGGKHFVQIRHGEEIPVLLDLCRHDRTVYYDDKQRTLRSGWNVPGQPH